MSRIAWRFYDPDTTEEYVWPVNPNVDSGSHARSKNLAYSSVAGSYQNGLNSHHIGELINVQNVEQSSFSYDGNVYNVDQLIALEEWVNKDHAVHLTDDLDRTFVVYLSKISFNRVRSRQYPYKHSYNISGIILEEI